MRKKVLDFLKGLLQQSAEGMSGEQKDVLASFLWKFQDIFTEDIPAGNCKVLEHAIVSDAGPIKQALRRISIYLPQEVESIIDDMKRQGVIEESQGVPIMIRKKDNSLRFCVNYRKLNAVIIKDRYSPEWTTFWTVCQGTLDSLL